MNIYLFYEHIVREYKALVRLKKILESKGHNVFIFSIIFETNAYYLKSLHCPPDIIFMPWFYTKIEEDEIYSLIQRNRKVKVIDFHHEELTTPGREAYFLPKTDFAKYGIFHLAWGEYFKHFLVENGVPEDRVFVTGNIRTDLISTTLINREKLAEEFHLDLNKKWILFAETRGFFSQRQTKSELKLLTQKVNYQTILAQREIDILCFEALVKDLNGIGGDFSDKFELIYRPHPGTHLEVDILSWVKVIPQRVISDWISNVDLFVSRNSTSVFEAEAAGVPCVVYDNPETPDDQFMPGIKSYTRINSMSEVTDQLIEELKNDNRNIYREYYGAVDGKAAERIADLIEVISDSKFDDDNDKYISALSEPSFWYNLKRFLYDIVVRFMTKTRIIEILKYPHSAYIMLNDIPYYYKNAWKDKDN